ncbi:MAG: type II secretion system protein GspG [Blastocatellia bacterium]|nr:type II secretion system protein GspG [Blastocatellia bacterium]
MLDSLGSGTLDRLTPRLCRILPLLVCCVLFIAGDVFAQPSSNQARKALTRLAGFELTSGAVRVKAITPGTPAEVTADIRNVFKFEQDERGRWRISEIRTAQDRWESIDIIAEAARASLATNECNAPDPPFKGSAAIDPSVKRARCLVGVLTGIEVPSDAVRIQEVDPMPVPLASRASAVVVAWIRVTARLVNDGKGWQVSELRTGNRDWIMLQPLVDALNEKKAAHARRELETMAQALERYRRERGFYVVSDSQAVLIDHLNPRYLAKIIRVDPWSHPYKYDGQRDRFTLHSSGPDGKDLTADDIQLSGPDAR